MQVAWRRIAAHELDHEMLWLSVSVAAVAGAALWFAANLPWPQCIFRAITGLPCLTCGATRSSVEFFHGHFASAWSLNPLAFFVLCALAIFDMYAVVVLTLRAPRLRIVQLTSDEKNVFRILIIALLALNWIWLLSHWRNI